MSIDLNADVGEGFDAADAAILPLVTSANIACGGHAGDPASMRRAVELALRHGVAVGAHPGYPDREGFGRRSVDIEAAPLRESIVAQLRALDDVARAAGARIDHVKPHGALYDDAAHDPRLAELMAEVVRAWRPHAVLVGLAGSALIDAGAGLGLPVAAEGFADRAYEPDGRLRPRARPGAVLADPEAVVAQALAITRDGRALLEDGGWVEVRADTLCLHGDSPGAVENARAIRAAFASAGITVERRW